LGVFDTNQIASDLLGEGEIVVLHNIWNKVAVIHCDTVILCREYSAIIREYVLKCTGGELYSSS